MELLKSEEQEKGVLGLKVKLTKEEFDVFYDKIIEQKAKKMDIKDFTEGKNVRQTIEESCNKEVLFKEVFTVCYNQAIDFAKEESGIEFMSQPNIDDFEMTEDEGVILIFSAIIYPKMSIKKYKGLEVSKVEPTEVTDESVNAEIKGLAEKYITIESVDRSACVNDTINFDFEGFIDGVAFEGGKALGFDLVLGSKQFIEGFEEQLIGSSSNQDIDVIVTFPANYQAEELASKEAVFKCHINDVKESILPEINDEFVKKVTGIDTLDGLKADIQVRLKQYHQAVANSKRQDLVISQLVSNLEGEVPKAMLERQLEYLVGDFFNKITSEGLVVEEYLQANNLDIKTVYQEYEPLAEYNIKAQLALRAVVFEENLDITDEEMEQEIKNLAEAYNIEEELVRNTVPMSTLKSDKLIKSATEIVLNNAIDK